MLVGTLGPCCSPFVLCYCEMREWGLGFKLCLALGHEAWGGRFRVECERLGSEAHVVEISIIRTRPCRKRETKNNSYQRIGQDSKASRRSLQRRAVRSARPGRRIDAASSLGNPLLGFSKFGVPCRQRDTHGVFPCITPKYHHPYCADPKMETPPRDL